uniref:Uncharacterized protein n=1 Tax=Arundo donax TaxID=35708 RepID=A0A0A9BAU9_ARUDO
MLRFQRLLCLIILKSWATLVLEEFLLLSYQILWTRMGRVECYTLMLLLNKG